MEEMEESLEKAFEHRGSGDHTFIPLHVLAGRLELPKAYLKRLADASVILFVQIGNRRSFNQSDVFYAIRREEYGLNRLGERNGRS